MLEKSTLNQNQIDIQEKYENGIKILFSEATGNIYLGYIDRNGLCDSSRRRVMIPDYAIKTFLYNFLIKEKTKIWEVKCTIGDDSKIHLILQLNELKKNIDLEEEKIDRNYEIGPKIVFQDFFYIGKLKDGSLFGKRKIIPDDTLFDLIYFCFKFKQNLCEFNYKTRDGLAYNITLKTYGVE
jgi:hypothetical protein